MKSLKRTAEGYFSPLFVSTKPLTISSVDLYKEIKPCHLLCLVHFSPFLLLL